MDSYQQRLDNLLSASQEVTGYLAALPGEAWSRPSACQRWRVDDVAAHLVAVAESYAQTVARGLEGDFSTPPGRQPAGAETGAMAAERIAGGAIALRERLGDGLLAAFAKADQHLNRLLTGLSGPEQERPCFHPGGMVPAANFVDLRLYELTIHLWDIQSSLEDRARLLTQGLPSAVMMLTRSLATGSLRWAFWPGPALSYPLRYRFDADGTVPVRADVVVEGGQVRLEELTETPADVSFRCDTDTLVLLLAGRISAAQAIRQGRLETGGDAQAVARFSQWFRGI